MDSGMPYSSVEITAGSKNPLDKAVCSDCKKSHTDLRGRIETRPPCAQGSFWQVAEKCTVREWVCFCGSSAVASRQLNERISPGYTESRTLAGNSRTCSGFVKVRWWFSTVSARFNHGPHDGRQHTCACVANDGSLWVPTNGGGPPERCQQ
jgi:hypothetical protein